MTTQMFDRFVELEVDAGIGTEKVTLSDDLQIEFRIRKTRSEDANQSDISITNLSQRTKSLIKKANAQITLSVGYDGGGAIMAVGEVVRASTSWSEADSVTEIVLGDGIANLTSKKLSLSFPKGTTVKTALQRAASLSGFPIKVGSSIDQLATFSSGYSYSGPPARCFRELAGRVGAQWSIQNGVLTIAKKGDLRSAVFLSAESGLIARIEEIESKVVNGRVLPGNVPAKGYVVTSLAQPTINPWDTVVVDSRDLKGEFVVDEVLHSGGSRSSSMTTRLTLYDV
jgi:hypothetical protein